MPLSCTQEADRQYKMVLRILNQKDSIDHSNDRKDAFHMLQESVLYVRLSL